MFLEYYGLREQPFGVTPNPRYLYHSLMHREALASLIYGIESDLGFAALIAEPGTGKTTLLFYLLEKFRKTARTALIFQTLCSPRDLLRYLANELEIETNEDDPVLLNERIKEVLVREAQARRRVIVIIDEAQNLDEPVLETIRLLSDFETQNFKLLHIILAGQLQLAEKLSRPSMAQLLQRVSMINRLNPLTPEETKNYIDYRLGVAGYRGQSLFTIDALALIAKMSGGVPRKINRVCFNALSLGCAMGRREIDGEVIREVGLDLDIGRLLNSQEAEEAGLEPGPSPAPTNSPADRTPAFSAREADPAKSATVVRWPAFPIAGQQTATTTEAHGSASSFDFKPVRPLVTARTGSAALALPKADARNNLTAVVAPAPTPLVQPAQRAIKTEPPAQQKSGHASNLRPVILAITGLLTAVLAFAGWTLWVKTPVQEVGNNAQAPAELESGQEVDLPPTAVPSVPSTQVDNAPSAQIDNAIERGKSAVKQRTPKPHSNDNVSATPQNVQPVQSADVNPGSMVVDFRSGGHPSVASSQGPRAVSATLLRKIQPVYPADARRSGIQGSVTVSAVIGTDGKPKDIHAISGNPILARAATDAVSQWLYQPYMLNGRPVEVETEVLVDFALR
jgi:general secretion pathway protein A